MNILRIIKELYGGKENLTAQFGIFALAGIMAIAFNEVISVFTGNTMYSVFVAPSNAEVIIFALIGMTVFLFFAGYMYQFVHENFKSDDTVLPSISMNCFVTLLKTFPIIFVWGLYIGLALIVGHIFLNISRLEFFVFLTFLLILLPFINIVFLLFVKNFKYQKKLFNPLVLVRLMQKTFVPVFIFIIQFFCVGIILSIISGILFQFALLEQSRNIQIVLILLILCVNTYTQQVLYLAYYKGLTQIIKNEPNIVV